MRKFYARITPWKILKIDIIICRNNGKSYFYILSPDAPHQDFFSQLLVYTCYIFRIYIVYTKNIFLYARNPCDTMDFMKIHTKFNKNHKFVLNLEQHPEILEWSFDLLILTCISSKNAAPPAFRYVECQLQRYSLKHNMP